MKINGAFKRRFKVNGKEYGSLEEMPEEVLRSFEKPVTHGADSDPGLQENRPSKIVFNGVEYGNPDEMPTFARNLYGQAMKAAGTKDTAEPPGRVSRTIEPESFFSRRSLAAAIALVALALLAYLTENACRNRDEKSVLPRGHGIG